MNESSASSDHPSARNSQGELVELKVGDLVHVPARVINIGCGIGNCSVLLETTLDCHDGCASRMFAVMSHQVQKCGGEELPSGEREAGEPEPKMENIKVKHIDAESICLRSSDGLVRMDLVAGKAEGGLWLKSADGSIFALFAAGHGRGFGYYSRESAAKGHAMDLAFTLDNDGQPLVQIKGPDGNVRHAMLNDLLDLLEKQEKQDKRGGCCNA